MGENLQLYKTVSLKLEDIGNALDFWKWAKYTHPKIYAEFMSRKLIKSKKESIKESGY